MVRSLGLLSLMSPQHPNSETDQYHRPQLSDTIDSYKVEIVGKKQAPDQDQGDASPQFFVAHLFELLLEPIDRSFQLHALPGVQSLLRGVIGVKRHVEIKRRCRQSHQWLRRSVGRVVELDKQCENENMNGGFQKLAVVNRTDTRNETQCKGGTRVCAVNGLRLFWRIAAARRRCLALNEFGKARLAINGSTHAARALVTECLAAADAERSRWRICVVNTIH